MELDAHAAYGAVVTRDARFDGRFFVGVVTTGIYCRPICRVRTPLQRNCRFFASAAAAEASSFRPCLKCRPEIAPGTGWPWTVMDASRTLARQAALALEAADTDGDGSPTVASVAVRLGISERHLRRIFVDEHGVAPSQYLQTRRLLLAKQLLTDTSMPVAEVALTSGFRSLRRFNAAFAASYRMTPMRLRRAGTQRVAAADAAPTFTLTLAYRAPYDQDALLRFFALRAIDGVEAIDADGIRRSVAAQTFGESPGWIHARFDPERAHVRVSVAASLAPASRRLVAATRRWLDLDASPAAIDTALAALGGAPGLRLPGCIDAFETAVRAVLGQQVTVAAARTLASRLVTRFGTPAHTPWPDVNRAFPAPETLARLDPAAIAELGIVRSRAATLIALARAWSDLAALLQPPGADPVRLTERLCEIRGIGPWTAHYIAMRGLGWPDAFPPGDVAVLKALQRRSGAAVSVRAAAQAAASWQPWRSYAVLRLWNSLGDPA